MPAETMNSSPETGDVRAAAKNAFENGQRSFNDALNVAERSLNEATKRLDKVMREGVDMLKEHLEPYRDTAGRQVDEAQRYVLERVKERPVTATLAGIGVGLLVGLLLANRNGK
jgi:ElaB/YqjD/DUF883 family membrane-anchored ribosome-binding protein